MKIQLKPFVALATAWNTNQFLRARFILTTFYTLVLAFVIVVFSVFLRYTVEQQLNDVLASSATITEEVAVESANVVVTGEVVDISTELRFNTVVYAIEYKTAEDKETDVFVSARTGEILGVFTETDDAPESLGEVFLNDFEENILLANIFILILGAISSYWLSGRTLAPIEKKLRQHEQFSADVAHELKTPLSALHASAEAAKHTGNFTATTLEQILKETKRLISLTERLLSTNQQTNSKTKLNLAPLIESVVAKLTPLASKKKVTIKTETEPFSFVGNQMDLEELIFNLVHNAVKFSYSEGEVTVTLDKKGILEVKDEGLGVSLENQDKIFNRFFTTDNARDESRERGAGLGLSIVKRIADEHQAKLTFVSQPGKGSTFTINFLQ